MTKKMKSKPIKKKSKRGRPPKENNDLKVHAVCLDSASLERLIHFGKGNVSKAIRELSKSIKLPSSQS